jgi:hypothetical protein
LIQGALGAPEEHQFDTRFVFGQDENLEIANYTYTIGKPLKFWVLWFLIYKNRITGSKDMTKNPKNLVHFVEFHFFDQKSFNLSNLVKIQRNSLLFFLVKYSKLNKKHEFDAKNIIKGSFKELLAFLC